MANILLSANGFFRAFSQNSLEPYIESFIKELQQNANHVQSCILADYTANNYVTKKIKLMSLLKKIKNFHPDLIIAFNNALLPAIVKNTKCPILIVGSDTPVYWQNKKMILNNPSRYSVALFNMDCSAAIEEELSIPRKRHLLIPYSTAIHCKNTAKRFDISFIGNFYNAANILSKPFFDHVYKWPSAQLTDRQQLLIKIIDEIKQTHRCSPAAYDLLKTISPKSPDQILQEIILLLTSQERLDYLNSLTGFDLHIWTWKENFKVIFNHYDLFKKIHIEPAASTEQNEQIYNASKISLNLPHAQVNTGFSWRVCDILASGAMLLSSPSKDLRLLFNDLIPTFSSSKELQDKVSYFLKHEQERKDIIRACHTKIEKAHRYTHVFSKIQDFYNIPLLNKKQGTPTTTQDKSYD